MSETYDVAVIGSGIGGLTAALTCARAGRSVLVLEAGKQFGGYTNPFARKHFHFDPGIHYIGECAEGRPFRHLLNRLGLEHVEFTELNPDGFDRYQFPDYAVENCVGFERFRDRLKADFPKETRGLDRFFALVKDADWTLDAAQRPRHTQGKHRLLYTVPQLLRWSRATLAQLLDHHFSDPQLKAALSGPTGDLGLPPSRLSALMHLGLLAHYSRGAYFPHGGSGRLRDAFVDALKDCGAELHRNSRVESIEHASGSVTGLTTADGRRFTARTIISNAQASTTYEMLGAESLPRRLRRRVERLEHSVASIVLFLGVDGDLDTSGLGSANVWSYGGPSVESMYDPAVLSDWRKVSSFFLTVPTNKDPLGGLAPEGMQTVELVSLIDPKPFRKWFGTKTMKRGDEYLALKAQITDHYLGLAERHLPDIRKHVVLSELSTPATNVSFAFVPDGNIYGPAHTVGQMPPFRFGVEGPVDGLFLCGASVMSAGVVSCAASGRDAGKRALKHLVEARSPQSRGWSLKSLRTAFS